MSPSKVKCLFIICALLLFVVNVASEAEQTNVSIEDEAVESMKSMDTAELAALTENQMKPATTLDAEAKEESSGRRLTDNYELDEIDDDDSEEAEKILRKHVKPLKNIFMGIYKNYKSTYLGNKTSMEYKQNLRERNNAAAAAVAVTVATTPNFSPKEETKEITEDDAAEAFVDTIENDTELNVITTTTATESSTITPITSQDQHNVKGREKKRPKRKQKPAMMDNEVKQRKRTKLQKIDPPAGGDDALLGVEANEFTYSIGPGVNMSLDMSNDVIHVQLDGENLRDILRGHWLSDNTEQGRGKKYDMMSKVLPLFILPFLIQSAIVPFLVTKLKLLLMKSILVGKLAIFLLIISALRNNSNKMQSYEVAPSYWASEPSRRSELAAAANSMGYGAGSYRVEGKPAWIN